MGNLADFLEEWDDGESPMARAVCEIGADVDVSHMLGPGCYALCRAGEVLYVGKAKVLIIRIYAHYNAMARRRKGQKPLPGTKGVAFNSVKIFPCKLVDITIAERALLRRFRPRYNDRHVPPPEEKLTLQQVGFDFTRIGLGPAKVTPLWRRL